MIESSEPSSSQGARGREPMAELHVPRGGLAVAEEWALVLASQGIDARIRAGERGLSLVLRESEMGAAEAAIEAYSRENPDAAEGAAQPDEQSRQADLREPSFAGVWVGLVLLIVYGLTGEREQGQMLFGRGSADAERIMTGEWWRCATALCLHANLGHVIANVLAGLYFIGAVCRSLGGGLGLALILLAGVLGNLLNAASHARFHDAVGASTAVFGAIGVLAGLAVARRHRSGFRGRRLWLPVGAGLGLLAMLGTSGARVDLWAHLFGLLAGGFLGAIAALLIREPPESSGQRLLALSSLLILCFCWTLALR